MGHNMKKILLAAAMLAATSTQANATNLLVNGNFEASSSQTATPPGWTNIGHSDGVIGYSAFGTPAYDGNYYYDIGGYGSPLPNVGDGITQSVSTVAGSVYSLTFGYSGENTAGASTVLDVLIGSVLSQFTIIADNSGLFKKPFQTVTLNYTATSALTAISFTQSSSTFNGNNDVLLDGISFQLAQGGGVPEPAAWAMMLAGFGLVGGAMRASRKNREAFA